MGFLIDSYNLINYNKIIKNEKAIKEMEFVQKYQVLKESIFAANFTKLYQQYCSEFGRSITNKPQYTINDSLSVFISYTFGMNKAIKYLISPNLPKHLSPSIID